MSDGDDNDNDDFKSEDGSKAAAMEEEDASSNNNVDMDTGDDDDDDDDDEEEEGDADQSETADNDDEEEGDDGDNDEEGDGEEEDEGLEDDNDEEEQEEDDNDGSNDEDDDDDMEDESSAPGDADSPSPPQKSQQKRKKPPTTTPRERYHVPKIFQDAVTVLIPLDVTADLKVAVQKTRTKRIQSIYKRFPALQTEKNKSKDDVSAAAAADSDDPMMGDDEEEKNDKKKAAAASKRKKLEHIPQPEQFGSVLDYLEAKYVKGVMLDDNDEDGQGALDDDKSEGQGSVYSKDSFLDDTDLQRDVAEQVMASTTLTKVELEQEDGDFFVNVGNLELENDDYGENYDPLQDKENTKAPKKKRKKSTDAATATSTNPSTPAKKKKSATAAPKKADEPTSAKSKKSTTSAATTKSKKSTTTAKSGEESSDRHELRKAVKRTKSRLDTQYKKGIAMIKNLTDEELPRQKTKSKVALTCPPGKKPGDDITFSNPHNPGQRLRVKVPKDCQPGSSFKVTVPVKAPPEEEGKDHNKFPREFQDYFDDFARAYDEWLEAKHAMDPEFNVWKERQNKFDKIAKEFPSNLATPVDSTYLKSALRRFRQNKAKRDKTKAASGKVTKVKKEPSETKKKRKDSIEDEKAAPKSRTVYIPGLGKDFPSKVWAEDDFAGGA